jgi:LysR family transcriptional regulator of abg operon
MKINRLRAFLAVADCGNINRAADMLHLTQSAVSKSIRELELELEVALLERTAHGMTLTEAGRRGGGRAPVISAQLARTRQDLATLKGELGGRLAMGVTPVTSTGEVAAAVNEFRRQHPHVQLVIEEERPARLIALLRDGTLDFAISTEMPSDTDACAAIPLASVRTVIGVRPGHPALNARRLAELMEHEWLTLDPLDDDSAPFVRIFRQAGLPLPRRVVQCASIILYTELARTADAVSIWSATAFHNPRFRELMTPLTLEDQLPGRSVCLLSLDFELMTQPARRLVEDLRRRMDGHAAGTSGP